MNIVIVSFITLLFVMAFVDVNANRASEFTRKSLSIQQNLASSLKTELSLDRVYLFDTSDYFSDAEKRISSKNLRYLFKENKVAFLSETAQAVFKNFNEYNQFCAVPFLHDTIGVYMS
ncbi:hypothetical protein [Hubei virga-like virus 16]|uniref:hypothetical protein n=1 Tax=Hubei virga-like virus 16 TaxID=1923331 RepID=UPI000909509C|nr:hypothetical protein [Hubei virga-like virus 16]APG77526.1 hypothetical protein [Hubei virga-like virus 16]